MRHTFYLFLSTILFFLISFTLSFAGDFNIKLRKTDINELKQQLMPVFEQNINILHQLLTCMEKGNTTDVCLKDSSLVKVKDSSLVIDSKNVLII